MRKIFREYSDAGAYNYKIASFFSSNVKLLWRFYLLLIGLSSPFCFLSVGNLKTRAHMYWRFTCVLKLLKFQNHSQYDSKNFTFVGYIYSLARNVRFLKSFLNDI